MLRGMVSSYFNTCGLLKLPGRICCAVSFVCACVAHSRTAWRLLSITQAAGIAKLARAMGSCCSTHESFSTAWPPLWRSSFVCAGVAHIRTAWRLLSITQAAERANFQEPWRVVSQDAGTSTTARPPLLHSSSVCACVAQISTASYLLRITQAADTANFQGSCAAGFRRMWTSHTARHTNDVGWRTARSPSPPRTEHYCNIQ